MANFCLFKTIEMHQLKCNVNKKFESQSYWQTDRQNHKSKKKRTNNEITRISLYLKVGLTRTSLHVFVFFECLAHVNAILTRPSGLKMNGLPVECNYQLERILELREEHGSETSCPFRKLCQTGSTTDWPWPTMQLT